MLAVGLLAVALVCLKLCSSSSCLLDEVRCAWHRCLGSANHGRAEGQVASRNDE